MQNSVYAVLMKLQLFLFIGLNVLVVYGFFRLWRKTNNTALLWLMFGLGVAPFFNSLVNMAGFLFPRSFPFPMMVYTLQFTYFVFSYLAYGCIFMGLAQLAGDLMPLRELFSSDAPAPSEKGS